MEQNDVKFLLEKEKTKRKKGISKDALRKQITANVVRKANKSKK